MKRISFPLAPLFALIVCCLLAAAAAQAYNPDSERWLDQGKWCCQCKPCDCQPCKCCDRQAQRHTVQTAEPPIFWPGIYLVQGAEAEDAGTYSGTATIVPLDSGIFVVNMQIGIKGRAQIGVGRIIDDKLAVGWTMDNVRGLTIYCKTAEGMKGTWVSLPGNEHVNTETLTLLKKLN